MINGLGYKLANVPTVTGLSSVVADSIISGTTNTSQLILNGIDVSTTLSQVPINTNNITLLQIATTGITYSNIGSIDLTTIDNNVTIITGKKLKIATVPTTSDDVVNKLYCDTAIANLVDSAPTTLDTLNELAAALGDDQNFATTVATSLGGKASLATGPQTITAGTTMNNASNVFYGNGANLTGITPSALTTTTLPATGTYYATLTDSSTGASSRVPYTTNQIYYDRNNNRITVPNIDSIGALRMTSGGILLNSTLNGGRYINNTYYNLHDNVDGSGIYKGRMYSGTNSVFLELGGAGHSFMITIGGPNVFEISSTALNINVPINLTSPLKMSNTDWNKRQIYNTIYNIMDGDGSAGGTLGGQIFYANPYVYIELTTGRKFQIRINAVNVFDVDSTAVNCSVPISSTSTVSGATLQTSGNIYLTNSSAWILATSSGANLSVGTQSGGGGLFLNGQGITGIVITGTYITQSLLTTFTYPPECSIPPTTANMLCNKTYVDSVIPSLTNYMTLNTPQTVTLAGLKTFTSSITLTSTTNLASLRILASSSVANINFMAGVTPTTSTAEITFGSANNVKSCVSIINPNTTNDGGIFLQAGNGGYLYGRNDGNAFNTQTSANGSSVALLYPIGFCFDIAPVSTKPVSVTALTTNASIALTKGVWQISGYIYINRSNGTFVADSNVKVVYPTVAGLTIYPNASGLQFLIPHTNTSLVPMNIPTGAITVVCTTAGAILTAERTIKMTVGTTTTWSITFSGVKIA